MGYTVERDASKNMWKVCESSIPFGFLQSPKGKVYRNEKLEDGDYDVVNALNQVIGKVVVKDGNYIVEKFISDESSDSEWSDSDDDMDLPFGATQNHQMIGVVNDAAPKLAANPKVNANPAAQFPAKPKVNANPVLKKSGVVGKFVKSFENASEESAKVQSSTLLAGKIQKLYTDCDDLAKEFQGVYRNFKPGENSNQLEDVYSKLSAMLSYANMKLSKNEEGIFEGSIEDANNSKSANRYTEEKLEKFKEIYEPYAQKVEGYLGITKEIGELKKKCSSKARSFVGQLENINYSIKDSKEILNKPENNQLDKVKKWLEVLCLYIGEKNLDGFDSAANGCYEYLASGDPDNANKQLAIIKGICDNCFSLSDQYKKLQDSCESLYGNAVSKTREAGYRVEVKAEKNILGERLFDVKEVLSYLKANLDKISILGQGESIDEKELDELGEEASNYKNSLENYDLDGAEKAYDAFDSKYQELNLSEKLGDAIGWVVTKNTATDKWALVRLKNDRVKYTVDYAKAKNDLEEGKVYTASGGKYQFQVIKIKNNDDVYRTTYLKYKGEKDPEAELRMVSGDKFDEISGLFVEYDKNKGFWKLKNSNDKKMEYTVRKSDDEGRVLGKPIKEDNLDSNSRYVACEGDEENIYFKVIDKGNKQYKVTGIENTGEGRYSRILKDKFEEDMNPVGRNIKWIVKLSKFPDENDKKWALVNVKNKNKKLEIVEVDETDEIFLDESTKELSENKRYKTKDLEMTFAVEKIAENMYAAKDIKIKKDFVAKSKLMIVLGEECLDDINHPNPVKLPVKKPKYVEEE
ncbi:MAG: hypothetical protein Q4B93_05175, partial [Clostridia bacterium]|nr:hypothetical protein [Clostridia bacterium]